MDTADNTADTADTISNTADSTSDQAGTSWQAFSEAVLIKNNFLKR